MANGGQLSRRFVHHRRFLHTYSYVLQTQNTLPGLVHRHARRRCMTSAVMSGNTRFRNQNVGCE